MGHRRTSTRQWAAWAVGAITVVWLLAIGGLTFRILTLALDGWPGPGIVEGEPSPGVDPDITLPASVLGAVFLLGPVLAAIAAFAGQMIRTGLVYVTIAVLVGLPGLIATQLFINLGNRP